MDKLPIETWLDILAMCCTDGGLTGCALSLVNSDFRRLSRPFALQSVSLSSPKQISAFAESLNSMPNDLRRVRHLCISDEGRRLQGLVDGGDQAKGVIYVLMTIADSLETLAMHCADVLINMFCCVNMPCLRELHITTMPTIVRFIDSETTGENLAPMPALRKLHIRHFNVKENIACGHILQMASGITHLRLSYVNLLLDTAAEAFSIVPASIEHLYLHHKTQNHDIEEILRTKFKRYSLITSDDLFPKCLDCPVGHVRACLDQQWVEMRDHAKQDWLDVVDGGYSCWGEKNI